MKIEILNKTKADDYSDEIIELFHEVKGSSSWTKNLLIESIDDSYKLSFIIFQENEVAGVLLSYPQEYINPLIINHSHIFLRRIVVKSKFRGLGLAGQLLSTLNNTLIEYKFEYIGWQTNYDSLSNHFFKHIGFSPSGLIIFEDKKDNIYWMRIENFSQTLKLQK